jgi:hypothetical protein
MSLPLGGDGQVSQLVRWNGMAHPERPCPPHPKHFPKLEWKGGRMNDVTWKVPKQHIGGGWEARKLKMASEKGKNLSSLNDLK